MLGCLSELPPQLSRAALSQPGHTKLTDSAVHFVWAVRLFLKQQYICLELYHRYVVLLPPDFQSRGYSKIARIAGIVIAALGPIARDCIDAIGPPYLDMVYRACLYLQESIAHLDDPFDRQQATADSASFFSLLEEVDALRRANAINARPRAYDAAKSLAPSRLPSPVPDATEEAATSDTFDPAALLFDEAWLANTASQADPSVGSMGLVNMLPYFNVPGYQAALEAYAHSPSDAGTVPGRT